MSLPEELSEHERERFDALLEEVLETLPEEILSRLETVPLIVEDFPNPVLLREMGLPDDEPLCGLHSGFMMTERSVEHAYSLPEEIHLYRRGIIELAGGWDQPEADDEVYAEIHITLLHELGHHFGLDEDDLERLGYD
jgi:predicted Zn-dependent protease with MMP-like domain